jgi:serine/threonine protein kinase
MEDEKVQQLGHYRVIKLLGHGGFADVYLGEHIYLHTQVAIKVLHTHLGQEDVEHFRNEALVIAHLVHPHIIRVLDFGVENSVPFLVMDYAPNGTLRQRAPKGVRLAPVVFLPYVQQVAQALQYGHDRKLIHRDVKPENMLLDADEQVRLSDFGIAVTAQSSVSQQTDSAVIGTISYMAPEQLQGKPKPASDQYALAVVVYEWLTGERPFKGSAMEIVTQQLSAPPPPIDERALAIPSAVTQVLWRALAKNPHDRFARVQDFADALERAFRMPPREEVQPVSEVPFLRRSVPPVNEAIMTPMPRQGQRVQHAEEKVVRGAAGCTRTLLILFVLVPLLLCGLGFSGYTYLQNRNPPTQATVLAHNFMDDLAHQNYDGAYADLGNSITAGTSHDAFVQQADQEDQCYGQISGYKVAGVSNPNGMQTDDYTVTRPKLPQPYHLHVTVSKDIFGNWSITDYNSDAGLNQAACG